MVTCFGKLWFAMCSSSVPKSFPLNLSTLPLVLFLVLFAPVSASLSPDVLSTFVAASGVRSDPASAADGACSDSELASSSDASDARSDADSASEFDAAEACSDAEFESTSDSDASDASLAEEFAARCLFRLTSDSEASDDSDFSSASLFALTLTSLRASESAADSSSEAASDADTASEADEAAGDSDTAVDSSASDEHDDILR